MAKTSVTIPDNLFEEAKKLSDNFSNFVTEAIEDRIRKVKVERALKSFGKWDERDKESAAIVKDLRSEEGRGHADGSD
jgi:post-segregation antitoxin (ccd killing protein)